jgi:AraC-like DNA-binding protein
MSSKPDLLLNCDISAPPQPGSATVPRAVFQSSALPVKERFDLWRESVLPLFESISEAPRETFRGHVESVDLGNIFIGTSSLSPLRFHRARTPCATGGEDHLLVQLYVTGGYSGHNGYREVQVRPGDISLLDLGRGLETRAPASNALSLILPREQVYSYANPESLKYGHVLRGDSAMGRILGNHLLTVWRQLRSASVEETGSIRHMLLNSVVGAFSEAPGAQEYLSERVTLEAIRAYIAQNLSEPLSPEELCRHFACSRAQLYRLFQPAGGVAAYVRDARLKHCWQELTANDGKTKRILDVALAWGFTSQSHFNRLFRQSFGMTPGEAVEQGEAQWRERRIESGGVAQDLPALHGILRRL